MKRLLYTLVLALGLIAVGCQKEGSKPENFKICYFVTVALTPNSLSLVEGESSTIVASISPDYATNIKLTWTTSNSSVAIVDDGVITAIAPGDAIITAAPEDGQSAACAVKVIPLIIPVESLSLDQSSVQLTEDDQITLTATVLPNNATNKNLSWSSSDKNVAIVDNGVVKALKRGVATISVKSEDAEVSALCNVTVLAKDIPEGAVDLGLSVFWAICNLGATTPEEYGDYYAWGEIEPKTDFSFETYKYGYTEIVEGYVDDDGFDHPGYTRYLYTKYVTNGEEHGYNGYQDGLKVLQLCDDAANNKLGANWRMPTREETKELLSNCNLEHASLHGIKGTKVTSKVDGFTDKWIFLPHAGIYYSDKIYDLGSAGAYWTSSSSDDSGVFLQLFSNGIGTGTGVGRHRGLPIRPVSE